MTKKKKEEKEPEEAPPEKGKARPIGTPLVELGMGLAWLLGSAATLQVAEVLFSRFVMAVAIAGAVIADVASTWAGVRP